MLIAALMAQPEPVVDWAKAGWELLGFLGAFGTLGALGYRFAVCDRVFADVLRMSPGDHGKGVGKALSWTDKRAGMIGAVGAVLATISLFGKMLRPADKEGQTLFEYVWNGDLMQTFTIVATVALVVLFVLAARRAQVVWQFALALSVALIVRYAVVGEVARLINPLHQMGGALWLGTLFVLVMAGFPAAARPDVPPSIRAPLFEKMVKMFNPLALGGAAVSVVFGVTTLLRHVPRLDAMWTTPYGLVLDAKLCLVLTIAGMGFYNWRMLSPALGTDEGSIALWKSARREVFVAAALLLVTAVLVSTPDIDVSPAGN